MEFRVYDVGHGFCASVVAENKNVLLFDCGHRTDPIARPSAFLRDRGWTAIEYFFITNYDEDHISDLPNLRAALLIDWIYRNPSISPAQLRALKLLSGPISPAMVSLLDMLEGLGGGDGTPPPIPGVLFQTYWNTYPGFEDTNNLSLVTSVDVGGLRILIPGDLETAGWQRLLERDDFRRDLAGVHLFVASHHGRRSGYCAEVFSYCSPELFIFSDSAVQHASQEMAGVYYNHATGSQFAGETRRVVSTRNDGEMCWRV